MAAQHDTTVEARRIQWDILKRLGGAARVELACAMSDDARSITLAGIRHRHPGWTDAQVHRAMLEILVGREVADAIDLARLTPA